MNGYPETPSVSGSDTSEEAARSINSEALRERVFRCIAKRGEGGLTDYEIECYTGLIHQTASARRRELVLMGRVAEHPDGLKRPTGSGRRAKVWVESKGQAVRPLQASKRPKSRCCPACKGTGRLIEEPKGEGQLVLW